MIQGKNEDETAFINVVAIHTPIIQKAVRDLKELCRDHSYNYNVHERYQILHLNVSFCVKVPDFEKGKDVILAYLHENDDLSTVFLYNKENCPEEIQWIKNLIEEMNVE